MLRVFCNQIYSFALLVVLLSAPGDLRSETYVEYVDRINSIKHELKPGDSLPQILEEKGYKDIYKHHGALNQTYWKNGIRPQDKSFQKANIVIALPYDEEIARQSEPTFAPVLSEIPKPLPRDKKVSPLKMKVPEKSSAVKNHLSTIKPEASIAEKTSPEILSAPHAVPEKIERKISFIPGLDEWNISALYGMKYVSIAQSGDLADADFGVLFLNDLKLQSEFIFEDWSAWFLVDSYKFKFESGSSGDEARMYTLDLGVTYKWMLAAVHVNQYPIFRNNAGAVEMARVGLMSLSLGGKKDIELPTRKPTRLKLKGWINLPVSSSTDSSDIEVSSVSGLGIKGQAELSREIYTRPLYSLHATWMMDAGYQKISQDIEWGNTKGKADSTIIDASTSLGLLLKF